MFIGDRILDLARSATEELILIAPFMRASAVRRVIEACPVSASITCVTRWDPLEIVHGVSDLEVWDVLQSRGRSKLLLQPRLHAKLYRSGSHSLIGSANLTLKALGWTQQANLELLMPFDGFDPTIVKFEQAVLSSSSLATAQVRGDVQTIVDALRRTGRWERRVADDIGAENVVIRGSDNAEDFEDGVLNWYPKCALPDRLYDAYICNKTTMSAANYADAVQDIEDLGIVRHLDKDEFILCARAAFMLMPIVARVDSFVAGNSRRWTEMIEFISDIYGKDILHNTPEAMWENLQRWLLHFLPVRYRAIPTIRGDDFQRIPNITEM